MTTAVADASALLAFLFGEPGAEVVEGALTAGASCSSVNFSEVLQKTSAMGANAQVAADTLIAMSLEIVPANRADATRAAELWQPGTSLSLADRFCLATAQRLGVPALTADRAWGEIGRAHV
jgi:PIN domain nuclease of toxin-antitoxin system